MFVLSQSHIRRLLNCDTRIGGTLLDIGAGDGNVTASIASLVDHVVATEVSSPMVRHLSGRGYHAIETYDLLHPEIQKGQPYHIIRCVSCTKR